MAIITQEVSELIQNEIARRVAVCSCCMVREACLDNKLPKNATTHNQRSGLIETSGKKAGTTECDLMSQS